MKKVIATGVFILIIIVILLNVHIIRITSGFEFTSKDHMTFKDTYVDVRRWTLFDYLSHSPRIRNYLLYERQYGSLKKDVEQAKKKLKKKTDKTLDATKKKMKSFEKSLDEWLSENLEK
ncbi:MAG: hypothetical protein GY795_31580 [Desulfobacterales bacterium]|nr:hypothetical protein [Desulfobacterales bacterium]